MTTGDFICVIACAGVVGLLGLALFGTPWGLPIGALVGGWLNA